MVLAPLVIDLGVLLLFLVTFALCLAAGQLVRALFQVADSALGWIPWLGSKVSGDLHRIEQRVTDFMGAMAVSLQHRIGAVYHSAARLVDEVGAKIAASFELLYALTAVLGTLATWKGVQGLYQSLAGKDRATVTQIREHTRAIPKVKAIANSAAHTATAAQVRAQAIPADVVFPRDLAGLRGRVRAVEDDVESLWQRIRSLGLPAVAGVAVGALAYALGKLGLGWARCSNVSKLGKGACRMDNSLLESLLADSLLIVGSLSLVEFAHEMVDVTDTAVRPIQNFWRVG